MSVCLFEKVLSSWWNLSGIRLVCLSRSVCGGSIDIRKEAWIWFCSGHYVYICLKRGTNVCLRGLSSVCLLCQGNTCQANESVWSALLRRTEDFLLRPGASENLISRTLYKLSTAGFRPSLGRVYGCCSRVFLSRRQQLIFCSSWQLIGFSPGLIIICRRRFHPRRHDMVSSTWQHQCTNQPLLRSLHWRANMYEHVVPH